MLRPLNLCSTLCLPLAAVAADPLKTLRTPPSWCRLRITSTGPEYFLGPPALDWTCKQYEVSIGDSIPALTMSCQSVKTVIVHEKELSK